MDKETKNFLKGILQVLFEQEGCATVPPKRWPSDFSETAGLMPDNCICRVVKERSGKLSLVCACFEREAGQIKTPIIRFSEGDDPKGAWPLLQEKT